MTEWKQILEFPNYEASSDGRIRFVGGHRMFGRNTRYVPPGERAAMPHSGGYLQIRLDRKNRYIHRIIAQTFLPDDLGRPHVNHKNGDKTDNRVENLEWCTRSENQLHMTRVIKTGSGAPRQGRAPLTESEFHAIKHSSEPAHILALRFGVSTARVYRVRKGGVGVSVVSGLALTSEDRS